MLSLVVSSSEWVGVHPFVGRTSHIAPVLFLLLHQGLELSRDHLVGPKTRYKSNKM